MDDGKHSTTGWAESASTSAAAMVVATEHAYDLVALGLGETDPAALALDEAKRRLAELAIREVATS